MAEAAPIYRFGRFSVDTREQQLTRDGSPVPITPKVFDTLVAFLRQPGRLLTKDDLLREIWPDTAVEEANLTVNVSTLRRLLAVKGQPPCIETVPRRGYRFVLSVEVADLAPARPAFARADKPRTVRAEELYARGNQAAYEADHWETARDLYQACVEEDPDFAPAWAQLARCHNLIAKFTAARPLRAVARGRAEAAFARALALDASLPLTQRLYAQFEVDLGRAPEAAVRLVRLTQQSGREAAVFAGLVHALRFCGLLSESKAAHERARALDPAILTSVAHTCWLLGEYDVALRETAGDIGYMSGLALASLGRESDAIAALRWRERDTRDNRARAFLISLRALLQGEREESLHALHRAGEDLSDPEAKYYIARSFARLEAPGDALASLADVLRDGFFCYPAFVSDPWLEGIRDLPPFRELLETARARHESAREALAAAGVWEASPLET
jgi:DNA-binding winged helix-turn-helix (wHTH) protein